MKYNLFKTAVALTLILVFFAALFLMVLRTYYIKTASYTSGTISGTTLIIDPGHGGEDGGAVSLTGTYESDINLAIALKVRELAVFMGIPVVMTRETDTIDYPETAATVRARKVHDQKSRVSLINAVEDGFLLSIHQNKYTSCGPFGAQVLFKKGSEEAAETMQKLFVAQLCPENRRVAAEVSDSIYLTKMAQCPGLLVECGFVSNPQEAELLEDEGYRTKLALIMTGAISQYIQRP